MTAHLTPADRPSWPRRAVVTAGMPYGNKGLHFGHVGGVFVPADFYARFLRDRLGRENVIFVSGTDCYGSPIMEGFRKRREADGYTKHISDYVRENHDSQEADLASFGVSCDLYAGSALEPAVHIHERMTAEIVERLHEQGKLTKMSTKQFFDPAAGQFLNGRQVLGRCPIQGCKSEKAYADECDLGHQFEPEELIAPKSALTGETPELVPVDNLYFDLPAYTEYMREHTERLAADPTVRSVVSKTMQEWLDAPRLFIQVKFRDEFEAIRGELPAHEAIEAEGNKGSFTVVFPTWRERDEAHEVLNRAGVRFRSGKALVPFRISGNVEWGVPLPEVEGCRDLTAWVWPESLWAPISFTRAVLARDAAKLEATGTPAAELAKCAVADAQLVDDAPAMIMDEPTYTHASLDWHDWWASEDARAYQFIGQDNIYFYCIAQSGMWEALDWNMQQSCVAANYHILYMGKKASSSSQTPPPLAHEMLEHYTPEQLRAHWLSLGLGEKPVSFSPKAFDLRETGKDKDGNPILARDDKRVIDPALKEGALLTGVFNRLARSAFYGVAVKEGDEAAYRTGCILSLIHIWTRELEFEISDAAAALRSAREDLPQTDRETQRAIDEAIAAVAAAEKPIAAAKTAFDETAAASDKARDAYSEAKEAAEARQKELRKRIGDEEKSLKSQDRSITDKLDEASAAQAVIDEAEDVIAHPEVTEAIAHALEADRAEHGDRVVEVEELANTERDVREQTRASRIRFIAAITGIALLAILAIWMLL